MKSFLDNILYSVIIAFLPAIYFLCKLFGWNDVEKEMTLLVKKRYFFVAIIFITFWVAVYFYFYQERYFG